MGMKGVRFVAELMSALLSRNGLTTTKRAGASIDGCHGIKGSLDSQRMGHIRG